MTPPPVALGLILCEQVIVDQQSQNPSTINIFTGLAVERFPSPAQRFSVFASLTGGRGSGELSLMVNRSDTGAMVYRQRFPIQFANPLVVVNVLIRLRRIRFPVAGQYEFVLSVDSDPVAHRTLRVYQA
jgi:hypothetical protein